MALLAPVRWLRVWLLVLKIRQLRQVCAIAMMSLAACLLHLKRANRRVPLPYSCLCELPVIHSLTFTKIHT